MSGHQNVPNISVISPSRNWQLAGRLGADTADSRADLEITVTHPLGQALSQPPYTSLETAVRCVAGVGDGAGLLLQFATDGGDAATIECDILLWSIITAPGNDVLFGTNKGFKIEQWHPFLLANITATSGTGTGVANGLVSDDDTYADTIVINTNRGYDGQCEVIGPASPDNLPVSLKLDAMNEGLVEIRRVDGTADSNWKVLVRSFTSQ
jgi:hypothetical protein